jgi:hypothetical protein
MLVSNQRPLPCESEPRSFAIVRCYPIPAFLGRLSRYVYRGRSSTFTPVVVKLSSEHRLLKLVIPPYRYAPECVERGLSEVRFPISRASLYTFYGCFPSVLPDGSVRASSGAARRLFRNSSSEERVICEPHRPPRTGVALAWKVMNPEKRSAEGALCRTEPFENPNAHHRRLQCQ